MVKFDTEKQNMKRQYRRRETVRALTVIETTLASPPVSWVAGSVLACQPVCHQHCLVFSLGPSAYYTCPCSGLTSFLYIYIFVTAKTSLSLLKNEKWVAYPLGILWDKIMFHKKLSLSWAILQYDVDKNNRWPVCFITNLRIKKDKEVTAPTNS